MFTAIDLANYRAFEKVRSSGRYNMFDPAARRTTGLDSNDYSFAMKNYTQLREANGKMEQTKNTHTN